MKNDLSSVKVGDYIWTISDDWMRVVAIVEDANEKYRIKVHNEGSYTVDGKRYRDDKHPSAFIAPPPGFNAGPKPQAFRRNQRVLVRNMSEHSWKRRYLQSKTVTGSLRLQVAVTNGQQELRII